MLLEAGYAILTIDLRGHGASGGTARLLDPDYEGRDVVQVLDWAVGNLPWLDYRKGNLVLGAIGESYGGGMQLMLHRVDPKRRLDAMVPDTTWHDLRRSLFEGGVFKSAYGVAFSATPVLVPTVTGGSTAARPDPLITEILATGVALNQLTEAQLELLRQRSPVAACTEGSLSPVDVLFTQGAFDTLFSVNEAWDNARCYATLGGDVRLWVKPQGHSLPVEGGGGTSPSQACGARDRNAAVLAWFDEKLKRDRHAADGIPRACFQLGRDGADSLISADGVDSGGLTTTLAPQAMVLQEGTQTELVLPLVTVAQERILAGITRVLLDIADAVPAAPQLGDPILFLELALIRDGATVPLKFYSAIRGYGAHELELPAVFERLRAGDTVALRLRSGSVQLYPGSASREPTPGTLADANVSPVRETSRQFAGGGEHPRTPMFGRQQTDNVVRLTKLAMNAVANVAAQRFDAAAQPAAGEAVLQLSMRRLSRLVANSMLYEFEDVVGEVTAADRVDVVDFTRLTRSRRAYKLLRHASGSPRVAQALAPQPRTAQLDADYALFFPCFNDVFELYALATIPAWRKRCRYAACYIAEMWPGQLPGYLLELLADFDHIFLSMQGPVAEVARLTGRPCSVLPLAADVCRFSPYPRPLARVIDVCNLGRRSAVTHHQLLELARTRRLSYYYDTVAASGLDHCQRTFHVQDPAEHRLLLAQLLRMSRYYVANRARINEPMLTGGWQEISGRFYEGAAAGVVMLGESPDNSVFRELFDWPEAVIPLPVDAPDIGHQLAALDADPERLARIGRRNARQAALRHDWVHRLRHVYATFDLPPTAGMRARETDLQALARLAEG